MTLTSSEMQTLANEAREFPSRGAASYLADAKRCLCDTRDPLSALQLLCALWGSSHAKRDRPKATLAAVGRWLDARIRRNCDISPERLALELGWLHRLIMIRGGRDDEDELDQDATSRRAETTAPFGAYIDLLRQKREAALAAASRQSSSAVTAAPAPRPRSLPETFEARFASWPDAIDTFRNARKRRGQNKPLKDHLFEIIPIDADLQPLARDLACSLTQTQGIAPMIDHKGDLPAFSIARSDLVVRDGKRVATRIAILPRSQAR